MSKGLWKCKPNSIRGAIDVIEKVAAGMTLGQATALDQLSVGRFRRALVRTPELAQAYEEAKKLKADALFDEALDLAREVKDSTVFDSARVRSFDIAINHLRWAASRLDPAKYSEKVSPVPIVPIQIITTLDLGQPGAVKQANPDEIYTIDLKAVVVPPDASPSSQEAGSPAAGGTSSVAGP